MSCIYSDFDGNCSLWDESCKGDNYSNSAMGYADKGECVVEDDPDPSNSCESFEPTDPNEYNEDNETH